MGTRRDGYPDPLVGVNASRLSLPTVNEMTLATGRPNLAPMARLPGGKPRISAVHAQKQRAPRWGALNFFDGPALVARELCEIRSGR